MSIVYKIDALSEIGERDEKKAKFYKMKRRWWKCFFWRTATIIDWIDFMLTERVGLANTA
ncbi:hypothetical protein [Obesumbacterium proteus]|nr:hypothetical protein [Obesumbacterium proteus]AMO80875.1 hypothetical protein DSM2777_07345 [Obesumbacterium proteus]